MRGAGRSPSRGASQRENAVLKERTDELTARIIHQIARRGARILGYSTPNKFEEIERAVTLCHLNGCALRLGDLRDADDRDFAHDVAGIMRHLNRETGQLEECFTPRFTR
jgi:hypothetical protein